MPTDRQNRMFIETLTEMWRDDRAAREDRHRRILKATVRRFVEGYHGVPASYPEGPDAEGGGQVQPGAGRTRPSEHRPSRE